MSAAPSLDSAPPPQRWRRAALLAAGVVGAVAVAVLVAAIVTDGDGGGDVETLPNVELETVEGGAIATSSFQGTPTVVNFWFTTCPPCARELADFATVDEEYGPEVRFVGVNAIDTPERMVAFAAERGVTYDLFLDPLAELQTDVGITSFPTTLFVDSDGAIVSRTGVVEEASLRAEVEALLVADQR